MSQDTAWHTFEPGEVLERLETSPIGLRSPEAHRRLEEYGPNELQEKKGVSKLALLLHQLQNPLIGVLAVAALISVFVGKGTDAIVIGAVILLNTAIGFYQEYRAEKALEALKSLAAPEAEVIRDCPVQGECTEQRIKAAGIVPGDILVLEAGDKVPADARIIEAYNLEIDESMLTGESMPVAKIARPLEEGLSVTDRINLAYSGSIVTQGRGKAVVFATGKNTELGRIAQLIDETEKADTPLKKRTIDLSRKLGLLAVGASALTMGIGLVRGVEISELLLFAIAMAVSAIPEGLPAVMSITLAIGVHRMAKRHAIIRKLQAVDTLGSATMICTDKTGTLTTNSMTLRELYVEGTSVEITGVGFQPQGQFLLNGESIEPKEHTALSLLLRAGTLCNDARLRDHVVDGQHRWEIVGDPTEGALIVAAAKAGLRRVVVEGEYPRLDEIPFDAKERYMATFHADGDDEAIVFLKGAPETILSMCSHIFEDGEIKPLEPSDKEALHKISTQMAAKALRVLGLAYQEIGKNELEEIKSGIRERQSNLILIGLAGSIDPPRPEATGAVELCRRAGIRVTMLTGDHQLTAEAIAREIGILDEDGQVYTGCDLDEMTDEELDAATQETRVWARVSPAHKHRIVESVQRNGHIVAMTGDGVNDAPALKAAEIGIAMGITGTDVTKETADMVLTDDNFSSIVSAVEEGRVVFENVRKVVRFLVSTNVGEIITILASLVILPAGQLIFTPIQVLWVNLVTDGLLDKALALEPKEGDVMDQPSRKPKERIISPEMVFNIVYVALFMAAGTLFMVLRLTNSPEVLKAQTIGFTTLAMFQVFNSLNCRSKTQSVFSLGLWSNRYLLIGILGSVTLQVAATLVPFLQSALGTVTLSPGNWAMIILVSSSVLIADEIRKFVRPRLVAAAAV